MCGGGGVVVGGGGNNTTGTCGVRRAAQPKMSVQQHERYCLACRCVCRRGVYICTKGVTRMPHVRCANRRRQCQRYGHNAVVVSRVECCRHKMKEPSKPTTMSRPPSISGVCNSRYSPRQQKAVRSGNTTMGTTRLAACGGSKGNAQRGRQGSVYIARVRQRACGAAARRACKCTQVCAVGLAL